MAQILQLPELPLPVLRQQCCQQVRHLVKQQHQLLWSLQQLARSVV